MSTPNTSVELKNCLVSVVIPTCHRNDLLAKCLDCLAPEVQTLTASSYEVVVSDDGSKTTAEAMVRDKYPWVKWVAGPRKGPAANRNNGAKQAKGEWLAFTDDDCLPEPQWLAAFAEQVDAEYEVLEGKTTTEAKSRGLFYSAPTNLTGGHLWSCNMMMRKNLFNELDGFDDGFPHPHLEDVDLRMRVEKAHHVMKFVPEAVVFHPQRPLGPVISKARAHESSYYMSHKYSLPLRDCGLSPTFFVKHHLRWILKEARSPLEATWYFITRFCVEGIYLLILMRRWKIKYSSQ